ncbi:MAG: hypothetical protein KGN02_01160 [bacterium]|nr:hypothetical protein [bacterium]
MPRKSPVVMRVSSLILALLFAAALCVRASATTLDVNPCTVVGVEMLDDVDSSSALPGDFFRFQTINAVTRGNTIVIPARTLGYGVVAIASPAGRGGRAGTLVLEPRYFVMPDGSHVGVVLNHNTSSLVRSGRTDNVPGYLGAIPVPGVGAAVGIFNFFHNGKNIEVKRGTVFTVFPSDDPKTERCQQHPEY